ncbi:MAG TPA: helix-turn-helix transcriptional regulator [Dehalococcoidia bacterium]|nr:helix-turn-helix transcriptional regulator [Dehalococcoidia bacterium]
MSRRGRPPYPGPLTPRQQEVLELVSQGLSNPEIAQRLGISTDGAKFHVSEIITRLGVTSRREAARWREERSTPAASASLRAAGVERSRLRRAGRRRAASHHYHRRLVLGRAA